MNDDLDALKSETDAALAAATDLRGWDTVRVAVLGRNGSLTGLLRDLGRTPPDQRKDRGIAVNRLKDELTVAIEARKTQLEAAALDARLVAERIDPTLPPRPNPSGLIHPIARTVEEIAAIFGAMGCTVVDGPDVESDWYNFGALNIPAHHPARQDHDTFYVPPREGSNSPAVLRTHTSPGQIRTMLSQEPPIRVIVTGRTYRADHDATHSPMFHQCEGLVIDRNLTLGHLKGALIDFLRTFFAISDLPVRFRSSYFPFTEPSMEVDIGWNRKTGELGRGGDWLEILGSGMVHPRVLANCGIDPREWQGFAWGMGVERVTMLKHGMADLRPFYESDLRWLRHYGFNPLAPAILHEGI
ncbi:MAG TPA: phenylalanine--tRNA ligase subunit alpha [Rhodopila sp.]|jgi:phenylalanyl-tRNA synthetase alpha chain|nr:phenylalanine--tRNA ligase subunit alpha [Rhodopila sp.]